MNLLLTGGMGYIGSHTAVALTLAGHRVVLYDNLSNSAQVMAERLERITGVSPLFVSGDVRDTDRLCHTLRHHAIETVIHFAGLKVVGESLEIPLDYYANNVQGSISLLQAMHVAGTRALVFSSSANVYGEPRYLPVDECHPTGVTNPYGRTKLHVEEILHDLARSDPAWRIVCLRYFNPVGAHESGLIGEHPQGLPNNLMPYIARVATGELAELQVFGNDYPTPDGTGVRDFIHVMDLAEGHACAVAYLNAHPGWQVINLGTGQGYSVLEMIRAFEVASGRPVPYRIAPRRPGDSASCYANPEKAHRLLNWTARRTLAQMCATTWAFQSGMGTEGPA
ncbi:UDP-glucose 4-epimerase [Candidatus Magnetaquicoccaceae bacterium FCR-1]|uniref:UDP-glucose 4-epimerase n=1 Tax=Candidatus Magnetaquiglobus chichijimensis TaxID=3141448 RepID=A0ABQ0C901_9PROT